jgi:hypothetical protein
MALMQFFNVCLAAALEQTSLAALMKLAMVSEDFGYMRLALDVNSWSACKMCHYCSAPASTRQKDNPQ